MKFYFDSRSSENEKGAESVEKIILFREFKNLILQKLKIFIICTN
jgi:hypothetical protein